MAASWLLLPLILVAVSLGCGLALEAVARVRMPGPLLLGAGLAVVIVVAQLTTSLDATAELTSPLVVALGIVGFLLRGRRERLRLDPWAIVACLAVYAVYAAPIVLSGQATFAGYIKLDDTATWMALADRVMAHGHSLAGLAPSTYQQTLQFNLGAGYPVGAFLPLGIGHQLSGQDLAWVIQPYMALLGAFLAAALYAVVTPLLADRRLRAAVAFLGAQPALLYGYYLWGGIKEMSAAVLLATFAGLGGWAMRERLAPRSLVPLVLAGAAVVATLSAGGSAWLGPMLLIAAVAAVVWLGWPAALARAAGFLGGVALLSVPVFVYGLVPPTSLPLTSSGALGNLLHPLNVLQIGGIWPVGDFRLDYHHAGVLFVLLVPTAIAAVLGLATAVRARAWALLLLLAGLLFTGLGIFAIGSPWIGAKGLATASVAVPLAGAVGACALIGGGRRIEGGILLAVITAGVLWSNALGYRDVNLAPRAQLAELETIGGRIAGQGPTLMTEYNPYGARHFLREADPEGASELRTRPDLLRSGRQLPKAGYADTDAFQLGSIMQYRTLVLRRSPSQSRPPASYKLIWRGHYYEAWQRPADAANAVVDHLPLGDAVAPGGVPHCSSVLSLAAQAGRGATLAAVPRRAVTFRELGNLPHPRSWNARGYGPYLNPNGAGTIHAAVRVPRGGSYSFWLGGGARPQVDLAVDGKVVSSIRAQLEESGLYALLGDVRLAAGRHTIAIRFHGADLLPGSGGQADPIGPLVLSPEDTANTRVIRVPASQAHQLCGRRLDWVEALASGGNR